MLTTCLQLSVTASPTNLGSVRRTVAEAAARAGAARRVVEDIRLCVSEAVANAALHAYGREQGTVDVSVERNQDELTVVVRDRGTGLAPRRERADGGHGLQIIETLSRHHSISSQPGRGTEVRMSFELDAAQ